MLVTVEATTNYYAVTGTTPRELHESKLQARPWKTNMVFDALTDWNMEWRFQCVRDDGQYRVSQFECKTKAVVTMPLWKPPAEADPAMVEKWQRYVKALGAHEAGHVTIARQATVELRDEVARMGRFDSAHELRRTLERRAREVTDKHKQRERDYDRETRHGASQGAELRWSDRRPPARP